MVYLLFFVSDSLARLCLLLFKLTVPGNILCLNYSLFFCTNTICVAGLVYVMLSGHQVSRNSVLE